MKRIVTGLSAAAAIITLALPAHAAQKPVDFRRTVFVPVAQKMLTLEAPKSMCFLDQATYAEDMLFQAFAGEVRQKSGQFLLAVFMDCNDLANSTGWDSPDGTLPNVGLVTWMNPAIGETTPLNRQDYLDMREASFLQYAANSADGLVPDKTVHRSENSVSLGMTGTVGSQTPQIKSTAMISTTALRHIPIEVTLRYTGTAPPALDKVYPLMDKFMAQQIALNK